MKFQRITLTALVTLPTEKFALLVFSRVENWEVITMINIFLPSFLISTHLFKSYLDTNIILT